MKKTRSFPTWLLPVGVIALLGLLSFTGTMGTLELTILDQYTRLVPTPQQRTDVVLIDADDTAIQTIGQWPWGRDLHAGFLADLRSLGARSLSFDVEFVDRGPAGVTTREREAALAAKTAEMGEVFDAVKGKVISLAEAADGARTILEEGIQLTARDNDTYLGQALSLFGLAFTTLNYQLVNDKDNADALAASAYLKEHSAVGPVTGRLDRIREVPDLRGAIVAIASHAYGAGVSNVVKDADGTLRRVALLYRIKGSEQVYGQLAFVPVWARLGRPPIVLEANRIILKTSLLNQDPHPDTVIPLDPEGNMVINWPHTTYGKSFQHVGISELQTLHRAWDSEGGLKPQVIEMVRKNVIDQDLESPVIQYEADRAAALAAGDPIAFDRAEAEALAWLNAVAAAASGPREADLNAAFEKLALDPKTPADVKAEIPARTENVKAAFAALRAKLQVYSDLRESLKKRLDGAIAFYGWSSVATTDVGVTPFDPVYYNVGTHASVANTILTGQHLNQAPGWVAFLLGAVLSLLVWLLLSRLGTLPGVLAGFGIFLALMVGVGVWYAATGVYPGALVPGLTVFLTVLGLTLVKFWGTEAERRYIRSAFGTYLSPEVIKQLEADPDKLRLGGEKKVLTAMFTDVKGFSTISEKMDPNDLVSLLNHYLTRMSDLILDTRGTIDKFEGDAIIAFWGAPLAFDDHAPAAVAAALRMKAAEAAMNEQLLKDGIAPTPLLTRIGINTGEMTVGNMGTARRMDYTMMGNAVNLAARLEGVNKEYGTWILTTEQTRSQVDDSVVFRKLDRVRVVGIRTPVRLFQVHSFRQDTPPSDFEKIRRFETGIDAYEVRDWASAEGAFRSVLELDPADGPAKTFLERTDFNRAANLGPDWDGVYTLTSK